MDDIPPKEVQALNIMDGMDAARFTSGNPGPTAETRKKKSVQRNDPPSSSTMPQVLRNLNNK